MKGQYLAIAALVVCLIWYQLKAKNKKIYVLLGIVFGIILEINSSIFSPAQKLGVMTVLSSLVGIYDFSYLQKVKGLWRYFLAPLAAGIFLMFW